MECKDYRYMRLDTPFEYIDINDIKIFGWKDFLKSGYIEVYVGAFGKPHEYSARECTGKKFEEFKRFCKRKGFQILKVGKLEMSEERIVSIAVQNKSSFDMASYAKGFLFLEYLNLVRTVEACKNRMLLK
jgi:arginine deiminase